MADSSQSDGADSPHDEAQAMLDVYRNNTRLRRQLLELEADAETLARAVSASLTHGEDSPLARALALFLARHPWSDL